MTALDTAIYERLRSDGELDAMLARSVIEPSESAVYGTIPVPLTAKLPYVVAYQADVSSHNEDVLNPADGGYRRVMRDIHAYDAHPDDGGGDPSAVQDIAERIRVLFHRQPLVLAGEQVNLSCFAEGPIQNDGDVAFGRVVTLTFLIAEAIAA